MKASGCIDRAGKKKDVGGQHQPGGQTERKGNFSTYYARTALDVARLCTRACLATIISIF